MDRADDTAPDRGGHRDDGAPAYSPGWVARRLGVTPTTLRAWHHRYDLGPTGRSAGGHRRYSPADLARLDRMLELTTSGVAVAEAARLSHLGDAGPSSDAPADEPSGRPDGSVEDLHGAAEDLDQATTGRIVADSLRVRGVLVTWTGLITPVLQRVGEQFARTADGIQVEHIVTEPVRAALGDVVRRERRWARVPPVLIAAADGEQHVLPLHALAAALAELGRPSVLLGASVPTAALVAAVNPDRTGGGLPVVPDPGDGEDDRPHRAGPARRAAPTGGRRGGPGWSRRPPGWATARADDLPTAVRSCTARPPRTDQA